MQLIKEVSILLGSGGSGLLGWVCALHTAREWECQDWLPCNRQKLALGCFFTMGRFMAQGFPSRQSLCQSYT